MLSGHINVVDGCDRVAGLTLHLDGPVRQEWNPDSLAPRDIELARNTDSIRETVLAACRDLEPLPIEELTASASQS